jgi:hypothetical protein
LDENLNWRLERFVPGHAVQSVSRIGGAGVSNGVLLTRAQADFDVLITMDGSIASQQKIAKYRIAVIALRARSNRLEDTSPLMSQVLAILPELEARTVTVVSSPGL